MSILRSGGSQGILRTSALRGSDKMGSLTVPCPKCQSVIQFSDMRDDAPVCCEKCNYPMIRRSDLFQIIASCKKAKNIRQAATAVAILRRLAEFMPEAGTALGMLPAQLSFPLPLDEHERWNLLENTYAAGNDNAREGLELMLKSIPMLYGISYCNRCGAKKYFERNSRGKNGCPYCRCTD